MYHIYSVYVGDERVDTDITTKDKATTVGKHYRHTLGKANVRVTRKAVTVSEYQKATRKGLGLNSGGHRAYVPFNSPLRGSS